MGLKLILQDGECKIITTPDEPIKSATMPAKAGYKRRSRRKPKPKVLPETS